MRIDTYLQATYHQLPTNTLAKAAIVMATASIAIHALSYIPSAEAGPIAYAACCTACSAAMPLFMPACLASCLPLLAAPTP